MTELALACEGLTKHFRRGFGRFTAVDGLDLQVPRGSTFGLLGPNGAGKTTTISMILGLVKPSAGQARILGGSIHQAAIRRQVGFVPEKFQLPAFLTANEFLALHADLAGIPGAQVNAKVAEGLARVGLEGRGTDRVGGFSKGMQQRLALAQALLADPALLILDEPTSALDPVGRREVRDIIRAAHARGATVVLNSHLLSEVEAVCDHVAIMRHGKLLRQGAVGQLAGGALRVEARIGSLGAGVEAALRPLVQELAIAPGADGQPATATFQVPAPDAVPAVAAAIVGAGGELFALVPHGESLEDTFMRLVGEAT
jgi:ABC-2 type transport system ATP-binding protein